MIITIMEKMPNRFVPDIELAQRSRPSIVKIVVIHLTGCTLQNTPCRKDLMLSATTKFKTSKYLVLLKEF